MNLGRLRARSRAIAVAVSIAGLVAGCGGKRDPSPPPSSVATRAPQGDDARLVVVGDSLAAGRFADTREDAFPQLVAEAMHSELEVVGVPGATTAQLAAQPLPGGGKVVVVEVGTNDFLFQTPRRQFAADYRALLAKVMAASPGATLVCVTTWVPSDVERQTPGKIDVASYDATIRRACTGGAVADVSPLLDSDPPTRGPVGRPTFLGPGDDFHPNSTGHAAIARLIESKLGG